jgi:hypothetical protein
MNRKFRILIILAIGLVIASTGMAYAGPNIPSTAIDNILTYKNGLQLTADQINKLTKYNSRIIDKMIQVRAKVEMRKAEVDKLTSDWSEIHGVAANATIEEYYDYMAKFKQLELEAIMKAKGVLTRQQMRHYTELVSVESMMLKLESEYFASF